MIDVKAPLRTAYYQLLNGYLVFNSQPVPVSDSVQKLAANTDLYVIMTSQDSQSNNTHDAWFSEETMTLDIVSRGTRVAKSTVDYLASQIFMLLFPNPNTNALPAQPNISITNCRVTDDRELVYTITGGVNVTRRVITTTQFVGQGQSVLPVSALSIVNTNSSYLMTQYNDILLVDSSVGAGATVVLPSPNVINKVIVVKKTDASANTVLIYPFSPALLNGSPSPAVLTAQNQFKAFYSDLTNFFTE